MTKTKKIAGYTIELDITDEYTQCVICKGSCSSSLEVLLNYGTLAGDREQDDHTVSPAVIDQIEDWALANGY